MKQLFIVVVLVVTGAFVQAQVMPSFTLVGLSAQKVQVTDHKMTNLVFPFAIRTGIKVSRDVYIQKVKGVENVIELRAARPHFAATNLSVFGDDGRLYSFDLEYADSSPMLNFVVVPAPAWSPLQLYPGKPLLLLTGLPVDQATLTADAGRLTKEKGFLNSSVRSERMRLQVQGIYLKDSLLWFIIRIRNAAQVPYDPEYTRLFIQDRTKAKRTAIQQVVMETIYAGVPDRISGRSSATFALGFQLFTVSQDKQLWLEVAERGGGRLLKLAIGYKTLLRAEEINK
jgi:conjugative transposon TraN protein